MDSELDRDALVQAAASGVLIVGPLAALSVWLVDTDGEGSGGLGGILFLAILVAFAIVGWIAGRAAPTLPTVHGALAAVGAFVVVQATILLIAFVAGYDSDPSIVGLVYGALLAAVAGTIGALVSARRRRPTS